MTRWTRILGAMVLGITLGAGSASAAVISITSVYGDSDCFGLGGVCGDGSNYLTLGGVFFADNRSAGDVLNAPETDIWKAGNRSWTQTYALGGATPLTAVLNVFIAGFADIGAVDLQADGVTIATYNFAGQSAIAHNLSLNVPLAYIDGSTVFSLSGPAGDGYIIDYSSLTVRAETVPEPAMMSLLALGLAGLGVARRNRK